MARFDSTFLHGWHYTASTPERILSPPSLRGRYEAKAEKVVSTMHLYNLFNCFLWEVMALSVMLVGVGVKLAIYSPLASPTAHFAFEQRLAIGMPVGICFGVQLFHTLMVKTRHHYSWRALRDHPIHVCVVTCRGGLSAPGTALFTRPDGLSATPPPVSSEPPPPCFTPPRCLSAQKAGGLESPSRQSC